MLFATVLALSSAGLHAGWNLLVKTSGDRELSLIAQYLVGGVVALPLLLIVGLPGRDSSWQLAASTGIHLVYLVALAAAYHHGDFSLAYPVARGGGAVLAAIGGVVFLGDHFAPGSWVAIAVIAAGLGMLGITRSSPAALGWAALTAAVIGSYSVVDADGSRAATSGAAYGLALLATCGVAVAVLATVRGRWPDLATAGDQWRRWIAAGVLMDGAYVLVLVAVRHAPVGYVSMLRESSVVIAAAAGWLLLHEHLGRRRVVASTIMAIGLVGLVWADLG
jgi:drug/metabolite transporter (DMT)-like permease